MRFLPVNTDALLVELDDLEQTLALFAALQGRPIEGVTELVPAARTVLVVFQPGVVSRAALIADIGARDTSSRVARDGKLIEIPVHYNGEDLDDVAQHLGITREEVVRRHTGGTYSVAFTGFAPGFAYLSGGDPTLDVPRRKTPRTRIPAGAVALAGTFSGVYPQASPGGWQILGVTPVAMWDLNRETPALLQPGYRVRFVDVGAASVAATSAASSASTASAASATSTASAASTASTTSPSAARAISATPALEVVSPGLQAVFEDLGRPGQARQGVAASGAMDQGALRAANRLVGNAPGEAAIEIVYGGFQVRAHGPCVLAVTGAQGNIALRDAAGASWTVPGYQAFAMDDGDTLTLAQPDAGIRYYLAARGGFAVEPVLGSCSTDTLARVGPEALAAGDRVGIRPAGQGAIVGGPETPPADLPRTSAEVVLDVVLGPRTDWCDADAVALLSRQAWTVTPQSNRVGIRLQGDAPLQRANHAELPSEGTRKGSIQVPASGQPVLFLADHPLTGGYPVIGSVAPWHLDRAAQIPIGARVRLNPISDFVAVDVPAVQVTPT
ncbi:MULTISPECIES: 5-oxoprolinase/urea amidolyase family protein [Achromobacter]|uniref:5-oxoprolinase/urea amidolyase family protein n=1 Tax=Achromobacter spanius TaxID=217203 RepID=A0ABY8GWS0_9BURK|nr:MULTISPECIES: 5-oxoprolinase/urea amidolyase family protein [Achromobacter]WAI81549.1 5-oxoprolinase/urea amidolyase family protein [Achromobacter spanius]WEX97066.1 5-oxoprolinase/urea amidolyase family protein [Achromobacter sp. SS2-2022]WFP09217.1 5-oxoprolinase/urea amidolyase family protein [Achromobacter spanius]